MTRHWLMKTEPDVFGIDDLARVGIEPWTGVRNPWATKFMRDEMAVGDAVLFYHSSCLPPGVAGLARVARTGVVDPTQFDATNKYFDQKATAEKPPWICVDVEFVEKLPRLVSLDELRQHPALADMMLLRVPRLSVQPVTPIEYDAIVVAARGPAPIIVKPKPKPKAKPKAKAKPRPRRQAKRKPTRRAARRRTKKKRP